MCAAGCAAPPYVLDPRTPPAREMPAVALPSTPPAPGAARVVLDTLDGPMRVSVQSDTTFVPPGSSRPPSRVGDLCVTPCVADIPAGRYTLFLAPTAANARGDTDDAIFGEGLNVYRRAPGKYETPSLGGLVLPGIVMVAGWVLATFGMVLAIAANGPNADTNRAVGGIMLGTGVAAGIGGIIWMYESNRATQQDGATTAWRVP